MGCVGNEIARYEWNIDGEFYDAKRDVVVSFSEAGDYVIQLVTTEAVTGCQDSCPQTITVN